MRELRRRSVHVLQEINRILLREWDPIGVQESARAREEYESYAPSVHRMLLDGASEEEIAGHLQSIEVERMGLTGRDPDEIHAHLLEVAASLKAVDLRMES